MKCDFCHIPLSSTNVTNNAESQHGITGKRLRALAKFNRPDPNSLFANIHSLKRGDTLITRQCKHLILEDIREDGTLVMKDIVAGSQLELDSFQEVDMQYLGQSPHQDSTTTSSNQTYNNLVLLWLDEVPTSGELQNIHVTNNNTDFLHDTTTNASTNQLLQQQLQRHACTALPSTEQLCSLANQSLLHNREGAGA